jgi:O-antigen/teichoic acid export membrane protein
MNNSILRFLPEHRKKSEFISTTILITSITSLIFGFLGIIIIHLLSPKLSITTHNVATLLIILSAITLTSIGSIADAVLLSFKDARRILIKSLWLYPLRILLPFVFHALDAKDIILIYSFTLLIGTTYELIAIYRNHMNHISINQRSLFGTYKFTIGNLVGTVFGVLPAALVPIIVLNREGASQAAYLYIPMQFASFLSIISSSGGQAFLAEASHEKASKYMHHLTNSLKNTYTLLVPSALIISIVGTQILRFYGKAYYHYGSSVLVILCFSSLFIAVNWLGDSLMNVQKKPVLYSSMNALNAFLVCYLVYITARRGLVYVSVAWLFAQILTLVVYVLIEFRQIKTYLLSTK